MLHWGRILDANLNRAREGLRVAEELARLLLEDVALQRRLKTLRHGVTQAETLLPRALLLKARAAAKDPGAKVTLGQEQKRSGWQELARANLRRTEEALRVLEEVSKVVRISAGEKFKHLRFKTYDVERDLVQCLEYYQRRHPKQGLETQSNR